MRLHKIWLLSLLLFSFSALAIPVKGINSATVPISAQTNAALQRALPAAVSQVLIKMSGNTDIMTLPAVQNALPDANQYIQSYNYQQKKNADGQTVTYVHIAFDANGLRRLLQSANQPIWGNNRPLILVWLKVINTNGSVDITSSASSNAVIKNLKIQAKNRGVPIVFPEMDITDQQFVNQSASDTFDPKQLLAAAKRYHAAGVFAGTLIEDAKQQYKAQWFLQFNDQPMQWSSEGNNINSLSHAALAQASDLLANQLAVLDTQSLQSDVTIAVLNVNTLMDYVNVQNFLQKISAIASVSVEDTGNAEMILKLHILGGEQALIRALESSSKLVAVPATLTQGSSAANLYYRWTDSTKVATTVTAPATSATPSAPQQLPAPAQ